MPVYLAAHTWTASNAYWLIVLVVGIAVTAAIAGRRK